MTAAGIRLDVGEASLSPVFFRHEGRTVGYKHVMVDVADLERFRMKEDARLGACGPCSVRARCWACPGLNEPLAGYAAGQYRRCLLYTFFTDVTYDPPCDDPYVRVQEAYRSIASYATIYGRWLEGELNGKNIIDGKCAYCFECTAAASPPRPCAHPAQLRASLEALGLNVGRIAQELLGHELVWFVRKSGRLPAVMSVVHGMLTNVDHCETRVDAPETSDTATRWLAAWRSAPPAAYGVPVVLAWPAR
jgi:hypothetical protein